MTTKVLIPLDGSELSDGVLPQVRALFGTRPVELALLRVLEGRVSPYEERGARTDQLGEGDFKLRREAARAHLARLADQLGATRVVTTIAHGDPTARILERIAQLGPDLVAMATHGRSGASRWLRGSVAERILRRCPVPLLMAKPGTDPEPVRPRSILVPTDGSAWAGSVVPVLVGLVAPEGVEVTLLRVAPDRSGGEEALQAVYEADLDDDRVRLFQAGFRVRVRVAFGDPAATILDIADQGHDLIAMTTHGRSGLGRWIYGSVAERVIRRCAHPLLLIRVAAGEEGPSA